MCLGVRVGDVVDECVNSVVCVGVREGGGGALLSQGLKVKRPSDIFHLIRSHEMIPNS